MALEMHDINAQFVSNDTHAWNQVKLNGKWYNFDMTNAAYETLTSNEMGKGLKSDSELAKDKIYKKIQCNI